MSLKVSQPADVAQRFRIPGSAGRVTAELPRVELPQLSPPKPELARLTKPEPQKPADATRADPLSEPQKTAILRAAYPLDGFDAGSTPSLGAAAPAQGLADTAYRTGLRSLTSNQLAEEKAQLEHSQVVSELFGDTAGASAAARKLGSLRDEQLRRSFESGKDLASAGYRQDLKILSRSRLEAEERKHFDQYVAAKARGETAGAEAAQQRLEAIHDELRTRTASQERVTDPAIPLTLDQQLGGTRW